LDNKNYNEYNDYELLMYVKQGSEEALDILFYKYRALIHGIAGRSFQQCSSSNGLELSDFIQEGMLGFYSAIQNFTEDKDVLFYTYAKVCIERKILSLALRTKRQKNRVLDESISFDISDDDEKYHVSEKVMMDNTFNPEKVIMDLEQESELLKRVRATLTDFEIEVFELKMSNFNYREIADILDRDAKAIDNALQRIRNKFKEQIALLKES